MEYPSNNYADNCDGLSIGNPLELTTDCVALEISIGIQQFSYNGFFPS